MAQNVTIAGASYTDVPSIIVPKTGGGSAEFYDVGGSQTITQNGTYDVTTLASAIVNVSGGGGSNYTLITEADVTVRTTSTSGASVLKITGFSEIWDARNLIYVRIRDKAGKRTGYFYGTDSFFANFRAANGQTSALTYAGRITYSVDANGMWSLYSDGSTGGYGVYGYSIASDGTLDIYRKYHSDRSRTIDGTYHIQVYKLSYPDGISPFDA